MKLTLRMYRAFGSGVATGLLVAGLLVVASPIAKAELETDFVVTTNNAATNVFVGTVGIGTNTPGVPLHVAGDTKVGGGLTVSGAMTIPRQGDVGMGSYTGGVSEAGTQGALPKGAEGNLLWHSGSAWSALTNVYFDASTGRLYFNSNTNSGTYLSTSNGQLVMGANIALGDHYLSRSGDTNGISIASDGDVSLGNGDASLAGGSFTVNSATGDMDANANRITDLGTPVSSTDAATKQYVDNSMTNIPPFGCSFFAYQSTAQSVGSGSTVTVRMDAERFDLGNDFTTWSGSDCYFTAPEDGYYVFGGACCLQGVSNGGVFSVTFRKNSGAYAYAAQTYPGNGSGYPTESGSVIVYLSQGNTMRLRVYNGDGSSHNTWNWSTTTYFWGYRLK